MNWQYLLIVFATFLANTKTNNADRLFSKFLKTRDTETTSQSELDHGKPFEIVHIQFGKKARVNMDDGNIFPVNLDGNRIGAKFWEVIGTRSELPAMQTREILPATLRMFQKYIWPARRYKNGTGKKPNMFIIDRKLFTNAFKRMPITGSLTCNGRFCWIPRKRRETVD